jgi:PUA-domain protein
LKLKRHFLKSSDIKRLRSEILKGFRDSEETLFPKKSKVEKVQLSADEIVYFVDDHLQLLQINEVYIPSLFVIYEGKITLPVVCVDHGAVSFVLKGADVMVPGITESDEFAKGDVIAVVYEETRNKPLGVGIALMSSDEIKKATHGKAIRNLHWLKDKYFEIAGI